MTLSAFFSPPRLLRAPRSKRIFEVVSEGTLTHRSKSKAWLHFLTNRFKNFTPRKPLKPLRGMKTGSCAFRTMRYSRCCGHISSFIGVVPAGRSPCKSQRETWLTMSALFSLPRPLRAPRSKKIFEVVSEGTLTHRSKSKAWFDLLTNRFKNLVTFKS